MSNNGKSNLKTLFNKFLKVTRIRKEKKYEPVPPLHQIPGINMDEVIRVFPNLRYENCKDYIKDPLNYAELNKDKVRWYVPD